MNNSISYPAVWRRLPSVPGYYLGAYYGQGYLDGVACLRFTEQKIKSLQPHPNILYFGPISVAELVEHANVHV